MEGIRNTVKWSLAVGEWAYLTGRTSERPNVSVDELVNEILNKTIFSVRVDYSMCGGRIREYFQDAEKYIRIEEVTKNKVKFRDEFKIILRICDNAPKGMYQLHLSFRTKLPRLGYIGIDYGIIIRILEYYSCIL